MGELIYLDTFVRLILLKTIMSGHSKWATTKRQKGVTDAKRANLFTKLSKGITVAAKEGGGVPEMNFKLKLAVDKAKAANMPKDNIERAIKKGTGEGGDGTIIEELIYEGFGPGGVAVIVKTLTDNKNRTASSMKHLFNKHGGNLGAPGSVSWMFEDKGIIRVTNVAKREEIELVAIEASAEDIISEGDSLIIYTAPTDISTVEEALKKNGAEIEYAETEKVAKDRMTIDEGTTTRLEKFFEALDEDEDVDDYYSNTNV